MNPLGDFHFLRPAWLLLAPVALWVWWRWRRSQDPLSGVRHAFEPRLLAAMTVGQTDANRLHEIGLLTAWLIAALALAGPTWRPEPSPFAGDAAPVMLLLKASASMEEQDLAPSRMERARLKAIDFAKRRRGQPLGLMAYAGSAHLVLPPTRDTGVVATMAAEISPAIMPKPGDDLAAALRAANERLRESGGTILVIADTIAKQETLTPLRQKTQPIQLLGIAREGSPEAASLRSAAGALGAGLVLITAEEDDVAALVTRTSSPATGATTAEGGVRWTESGWWLVPLLVAWQTVSFRRVIEHPTMEVDR